MEELLAQERAAEQHVYELLKKPDEPILNLLQAFASYRRLCLTIIAADFQNVENVELRLWRAHCAGKSYFHVALSSMRKRHTNKQQPQPVETRKLMRLYLDFIKKSQVFYREYIYTLSSSSVGIPQLEAIAQMRDTMKDKNNSSGESQPLFIAPELRSTVLKSAHQCLIYLGDLSRWRASEQLDKVPEFGPAIGYYGLAATLMPSSGMGHHQQAVVELEQRHHLYTIYHLYRALVVTNPHPNAASNLHAEFKKTNAAWDKGELIKKGPPNDPEAPKRALVGWFVRLHSICYKGETFAGFDDLEREVLGQMSTAIKQHLVDDKYERLLRKMILVNLAAQHWAGERFQSDPDKQQNQQSFFYFFRFNISTFTSLCRLFYDELKARLLELQDNDAELAVKITLTLRRILPSLCLYNMWLISMVHMVVGLSSEPFLAASIAQFWPCYARAIDLIAQGFPIWDLEDADDVTYMLEEEVDTIEFQPLMDAKTMKTWQDKKTGLLRRKFTDADVVKSSRDDEMLQRIKNFLSDGLYLANDDDDAPVCLRGTRILCAIDGTVDDLIVRPREYEPIVLDKATPPISKTKPAPVSYAAMAAKANALNFAPPSKLQRPAAVEEFQTRENQLQSMVADLVDDDDGNNPITPPQPAIGFLATVSNGDVQFSADDTAGDLNIGSSVSPCVHPWSHQANATLTPPMTRTSPSGHFARHDRIQSVANLWENSTALSSPYHGGATTGTLQSPIGTSPHNHSRVNSASSVRSKTSQNIAGGPWTSLEKPLLFGASGSVWSTPVARSELSGRNVTPPNGQGG